MNDTTPLERLVADVTAESMGPSRPFDPAWIVQSAKTMAPPGRRSGLLARLQGGRTTLPEGGFSMFSALKFIAAAAIVALFGGFLLAGTLTTPQGDEMVPAAVTESPSPMTTEELLTGMVTEEVEPGVFRVVNDGVRDFSSADYESVFAGQDGSIWLKGSGHLSRLGVAETHDWQLEEWYNLVDLEVAHDGTVWAVVANEEESALLSFDGEARTIHRVGDLISLGMFGDVEITSDGVVWASLKLGTLGYLEDDGSTWHDIEWPLAVGPNTYHGPWFTLIGSDVWVADREDLWHYADGVWQQIDYGDPDAAVLPEGVIWDRRAGGDGAYPHYLYRHDETGSRQWPLGEYDMLPAGYHWGNYDVASDGRFWAGWAVYDSEEFRDRCEGVSRFDGRTWVRYLPGMCVPGSLYGIDIAPDGSVWLTAWEGEDPDAEPGPDLPGLGLYVITPEAVAATE